MVKSKTRLIKILNGEHSFLAFVSPNCAHVSAMTHVHARGNFILGFGLTTRKRRKGFHAFVDLLPQKQYNLLISYPLDGFLMGL